MTMLYKNTTDRQKKKFDETSYLERLLHYTKYCYIYRENCFKNNWNDSSFVK